MIGYQKLIYQPQPVRLSHSGGIRLEGKHEQLPEHRVTAEQRSFLQISELSHAE